MESFATAPVLTVLVVAATLLVSALAGWPITALVLRYAHVTEAPRVRWSGDTRTPVVERDTQTDPLDDGRREVLRGGTWIGVLERLAFTAAVVTGRFELAAVVVAIKALGRYPEIRENPAVSERFIIGTLASLLVAGLCGAIGLAVLAAL